MTHPHVTDEIRVHPCGSRGPISVACGDFHDTPLPQTFQQEAEQWRVATNRLGVESKLTPLGELVRAYLDADDDYQRKGTRTNHNRRTVAKRKLRESVT